MLVALAVVAALLSSDWQTHHDDQAGYTVEYPAEWSVDFGDSTTHFTSPSGRVGIVITVDDGVATDAPEAPCSAVTVAGLPALSCEDILTFSVWTSIIDGGRTVTIATSAKNYDARAYAHVVDSFTP